MHTRIYGEAKGKGNPFTGPLTQKALIEYIKGYLNEIAELGHPPVKVILFGSYANGKPDAYSDIDLAVWAEGFEGNLFTDSEKVMKAKRNFVKVELHPYAPQDTADDDPFVAEIEKTGIRVDLL